MLLERARGARNGAAFSALYDHGNLGGHGDDHSSADLALVNHLVYWADGDADQVDRLFRASALMRPEKWDRSAGACAYGALTMATAMKTHSSGYTEPMPQDAATPLDDLPDDVATLRAMVAVERRGRLEAERRADTALVRARELVEERRLILGILGNADLGPERLTAVGAFVLLTERRPDERGLTAIPLQTLTARTGTSTDTGAAHLRKLAKLGVIEHQVDWVGEAVNADTGELTPAHRQTYVAPTAGSPQAFALAVAQLKPEEAKAWGGIRRRCPDHPNADIVRTTTLTCAECATVLEAKTEVIHPPMPQDAGTPPAPEVEIPGLSATRGNNVTSGIRPTYHNVDSPVASLAASWIAGPAARDRFAGPAPFAMSTAPEPSAGSGDEVLF